MLAAMEQEKPPLDALTRLRALQASHAHVPMQSFKYTGRVYVRPAGRGICLLDPPQGSLGYFIELDPDPGTYQAVIRFERIPDLPD